MFNNQTFIKQFILQAFNVSTILKTIYYIEIIRNKFATKEKLGSSNKLTFSSNYIFIEQTTVMSDTRIFQNICLIQHKVNILGSLKRA